MKYIFFTELRSPKSSSQNFEAQNLFLKECRAKIAEATEVVPKGAQRKFSAQKSFLRGCRTYTAEIEGEEVPKSFLRGCRTYTEKKKR
jgi:hypothetical protein